MLGEKKAEGDHFKVEKIMHQKIGVALENHKYRQMQSTKTS